MTTRLAICALPLALAAGSAAAGQHHLDFSLYTGYTGGPDPLSGFSFTIDADESQGTVDFTVSLDATAGVGTVTRIWFEQGTGLGSLLATSQTGTVNMSGNGGGPNPAGSNGELSWLGTFDKHAKRGSANNGVDAGESFTMRYATQSAFFTTGLDALLNGDARVAFHLQRMGSNGNQSAHFVSMGGPNTTTVVPMPAAGALAGVGLLAVGTRRRR